MTRFITIRLEIPDGIDVRFGSAADDQSDPLPPSWIPQEEPDEVRTIVAGRNGSAMGSCPLHRVPWRMVPAGISKKTGRPYSAFVTCPEPGCDERPPMFRRTAS